MYLHVFRIKVIIISQPPRPYEHTCTHCTVFVSGTPMVMRMILCTFTGFPRTFLFSAEAASALKVNDVRSIVLSMEWV